MAFDLVVHLTDSELALITSVANKVSPGISAQDLQAWAAARAKAGLRASIMAYRAQVEESEAIATRINKEAQAAIDFPEII